MKKTKNVLLLLLCGGLFFAFAVGSSGSDGDLNSGSSGGKQDELEVTVESAYASEYGIAYYIEGKAKNLTDKKFSYVQVSFNVYDAEGTVIGSCFDNQNDVMGGETWKFKAICSGDANAVANYKYTGYTAY